MKSGFVELFKVFAGNIWRSFGYYIFFFAVFIFFELLLRLSAVRQVEFGGFLFSMFFNLFPISLFCYAMSFASKRARIITSNVVLGVASAFYVSQIIYYNVFGTFYNPVSMRNAGQIVEFWGIILNTAWHQAVFLLLCVAPVPVYNLLVRKTTVVSVVKRLKKLPRMEAYMLRSRRYTKLAVLASAYVVMLFAFIPFAENPGSAYSLFFGQQSYEDSIRRAGLLPTLQIDLLKVFVKEDMSGPLMLPGVPRDSFPEWNGGAQVGPDFLGGGFDGSDYGGNGTDDAGYGGDGFDGSGVRVESGGDLGEVEPAEVEYGYNVMDIDFNGLIADEDDNSIITLHEYFAYVRPTRQNVYTGLFSGYNLVMFTAEGFSPFAVHPELTPTLYKLVNKGFHFTDFYTSEWGVSTTDGEYVACTGLLPKSGVWSFYKSSGNYLPFTMGNQLGRLGYQTNAYHNHTHSYYSRDSSHPNMGYVYKGVGNGLELPQVSWPNSDLEMMEVTVDDYIDNQPFHAYYMTVSGHLEYNFVGNAMAIRNKGAVDGLPYSEACRAYIACNIELDKALEYLLDRLSAAGIAEKTVIVLSSDHHPYGLLKNGLDGISEFLGHKVDSTFELYKNHLVVYTEGMMPTIVDKPCSSLDIIPTLSNLFGLEYDSRLLMGRDILSDCEPLVVFKNRSFITDKGYYTSSDGFVPNPGVEVDEDYIRLLVNAVATKFIASARVLELDYYSRVLG